MHIIYKIYIKFTSYVFNKIYLYDDHIRKYRNMHTYTRRLSIYLYIYKVIYYIHAKTANLYLSHPDVSTHPILALCTYIQENIYTYAKRIKP